MVAPPARTVGMHGKEKRDMPVMDCPSCDGTGVLFVDEGDPDTNAE